MTPVEVGLIGMLILFILLAFGLEIGFGMAAIGFVGLWYLLSSTPAIAKITFVPFATVSSYSYAVIPLFLLMANVTFVTGITTDLYNLAAKWLGYQRGGIAMATVGACAGFAAISASSLATASTMGQVALPEMKKYNYDSALATGCVAAGGTIGILIPPSSVLIIYGILTETSIRKLFMAGLIPGILEAVFYIITIYILCAWRPSLGPRAAKTTFREKVGAFKRCGDVAALIILVLGGLMIGWFTPTEAGAVAAFGGIFFSLLRRRLTWTNFVEATNETLKTTGMLYCILIGVFIFMYFVTVTNIPYLLAEVVSGLPLPPLAIMGCMILLYIILGCFLDAPAMIALTIPIFFPVAKSLGFDPIWFGVIMVRVVEMGMITPPIGMNVYIIAGVAPDLPMTTIFKGIAPFLVADVFHVALLLFVPGVVLFLPNLIS